MAISRNPDSLRGFVSGLQNDSEMRSRFERAPLQTLESEVANMPRQIPNNRIYRMVVGALGMGLLLSLVAAAWITIAGGAEANVPDIFVTAASTIIGALAGLLAPQPDL